MGDCFNMCGVLRRSVTCTLPIDDRPIREPRSREVIRQQFRGRIGQVRRSCFQLARDARVEVLPLRAEETAVSGILHEGVLEDVGRLWLRAAAEDQFSLDELRKGVFELSGIHAGDRCQQIMAELPPDDRADLRHFAEGPQPVEASHQQVAQRGWNGKRLEGPGELVVVLRIGEQPKLQSCLGQFLDE